MATLADAVWINARSIHGDQTKKDGNKSGPDHVETVEHNIWKLLAETYPPTRNKPYLEILEPHDLFLLSLAACCHDFDKGVRDEAIRKTFEHGEGSADMVMKTWSALGLESKHVARWVAEIVSIHDCKEDFPAKLGSLSEEYSLGNRQGNLRRLALILKAADTLHCDHTRVHDRETYSLDPDPDFASKGLARAAISGWRIRKDSKKIWIDAYVDSDDCRKAFEKFIELTQADWKPLEPLLDGYGFPYELKFNVTGPCWLGDPSCGGGTLRIIGSDTPGGPLSATIADVRSLTSPLLSDKPLQLIAVPPDRLAEHLCETGKLSVIGNPFVRRQLTTLRSSPGALNRIFVGPADRGKTRSAYEWIMDQVRYYSHAWTIIRPVLGSIPHDAGRFELDSVRYYGNTPPLVAKAILFADDLPEFLASQDRGPAASQAVQRLLTWFSQFPGFTTRHFVGTMRSELTHNKRDWPESLAELGELDVLRVEPLDAGGRRALWEGLPQGKIWRVKGPDDLDLQIDEGFLDAVALRESDPEAIAYYIKAMADRGKKRLAVEDAESYVTDVAEMWRRETWPAVRSAYGIAACVFLTIARFLEAGIRRDSGFPHRLEPAWEYHAVFGPPLLADSGGRADEYVPALERMIRDGHAIGEPRQWIRPRFDFLMQAPSLGNIEVSLPDSSWLARPAGALSASNQITLAYHLSSANRGCTDEGVTPFWFVGHLAAIEHMANESPEDSVQWGRVLVSLEEFVTRYVDDKVPAVRARVAHGFLKKGILLGNLGRTDEEFVAYEDLVTQFSDDTSSEVRQVVAVGLVLKSQRLTLLGRNDEALEACEDLMTLFGEDRISRVKIPVAYGLLRKALVLRSLQRDEEALVVLDELLDRCADVEIPEFRTLGAFAKVHKAQTLRSLDRTDTALAVYETLAESPGEHDVPEIREWAAQGKFNQAVLFGRQGKRRDALERLGELVDRYANDSDPKVRAVVAKGLLDKGLVLGGMEQVEGQLAAYTELVARYGADETPEITKAVASALSYKTATLLSLWRASSDEADLAEAVSIGRQAMAKGASSYNLACALALSGELDEAFHLLERALAKGEVLWPYMAEDLDWAVVRDNARYRELEKQFGAKSSTS